jgi:HEAT repeat protein
MLRLIALLPLVGLTGLAPIAWPQQKSGSPAVNAPAPKGTEPAKSPETGKPGAPAKATEPGPTITFKDGRLTVRVRDHPLEGVLDEISRKAKVAVTRGDGVGAQRVSIDFKDLPLDEGLRQIVKDHDAFLFYGVEQKPPASLKAVWVYQKGRGRDLAPVPPEQWASTQEIERKLADPDPAERSRSVTALIDREGERAFDVVVRALKDPDDQVRTQALYGALTSGVEVPAGLLMDMALRDASAEVRFLALQGLAEHPDVRPIAESALNDPNPNVRIKAQEILYQLDNPEGEAPASPSAPSE